MKICRYIVIYSFLFVLSVGAQPLSEVKYYTVQDGLTHSMVNDILQDHNGLIWIGTWNGLTKFNGYDFSYYKSYPGDGCTMRNTRIVTILENKKGNIWCHTQDNRAYLFDVKSERFIDVLQKIEEERHQTNQVTQIFTLKKGFTWITCSNGNSFRIDDAKYSSGGFIEFYGANDKKWKGDTIYSVQQDAQNDEWILTDKGVSILGKKKLSSNLTFHFFIETNKQVWLGSRNGLLAKYIPSKSKIQLVDLSANVPKIILMKALKSPYIGIGTNQGFILFNTENAQSELIPIPGTEGIELFYEDKLGNLWLFDSKPGVLYVDRKMKQATRLQSPIRGQINPESTSTQLVYEDRFDNLWVIPRGGNLSYFDRDEKKLNYYFSNPEDPSAIASPPIRSYLPDHQGNLWFGTTNSFGKISFFNKKFTIKSLGTKTDECRALLRDSKNNLWVASKDGKIRLFDTNDKLLGYISANGSLQKQDCSFGHNAYCIIEDHFGNFWIGTKKSGLFWFKKNGKEGYNFKVSHFIHNPLDKFSINHNSVYTLAEDNRHRIWIGTFGGGLNLVVSLEQPSIRFLNFGNQLKNYPFSHGLKVRHLIEGTNGTMLIGTTDGLISFSSSFTRPEEIRFFWNTRKAWDKASLSNNDVMYLYKNRKNRIFLATQSGGLNEITSKELLTENLTFKIHNELNGLPSDLTRSIIEDKNGYLWITSQNSLTRFDPNNTQFENYDSYSFKQPIQFSEGAVALNAHGEIVIGTFTGLIQFDPQTFVKKPYVPSILFTNLKIQGNIHLPIENSSSPKIELKASQRNFTIQFSALDYRDSKKIRYTYYMEGLDKEWHYVERDHSASYINVPHGHFRFLVKSTNSDGDWVNNTKVLSIVIAPTFWETGWAWTLYILLFLGLLVLVVYILFTFYRLQHEVDMEQKLTNIKLRFFTDISHELRTPLTLISSPVSEVLENEQLSPIGKEHLQLVQNNTDRMLKMVNQILDFRKIQNHKMNVLIEEVEIVSFVVSIMENFQQLAREKNIDFRLESGFDFYMLWIDKDKFEKILYNLLSNAFKFTPSGKSIIVGFRVELDKVLLTIKDQGIGIHEKKLGLLFQRFESLVNLNFLQNSTGIGLSLTKELVELHHGTIEASSQLDVGSEFKVTFLKGRNHFLNDKYVEFVVSDTDDDSSTPYPTEVSYPAKDRTTDGKKGVQEKKSILIVEDNKELSRFIRNVLLTDFLVFEAENGKVGFDEAIRLMPDMILSDVMMPVMDGLDMVKLIKENNDICHIPIILLSAKTSLDDRIMGLEQGIDDYLTKPFSAKFLKTRIHILFKQREFLQDAFLASLSKSTINLSELNPSHPQICCYDEHLIKKIMEFMENNIGNPTLTIDDFVKELNISRTILYRKMKTLLGVAPVDFIRDIRLKRSIQLLESGVYSVSEISYRCGFNDPNYFAKVFREKMGVSPKAYKLEKRL